MSRRRQTGISALEVSLVVAGAAIVGTLFYSASGAMSDRAEATHTLRVIEAIYASADRLRTSGTLAEVVTLADLPAANRGPNGLTARTAYALLQVDASALATLGRVGINVTGLPTPICVEVARQATHRYGEVVVNGTVVGGQRDALSSATNRGQLLRVGDDVLHDRCSTGGVNLVTVSDR